MVLLVVSVVVLVVVGCVMDGVTHCVMIGRILVFLICLVTISVLRRLVDEMTHGVRVDLFFVRSAGFTTSVLFVVFFIVYAFFRFGICFELFFSKTVVLVFAV